uniref:Uncharacterized protein n=1 Tax=Sinocyclocheilus grahami TaxID=75366 RepID=A0A672PIJ3_SINGR
IDEVCSDSSFQTIFKMSNLQLRHGGNEGAQNYFDHSLAAEGDPRRCMLSGVRGRDEVVLSMPFFLVIGHLSSLKWGERDHSYVSLQTRLGGHMLCWSRLQEHQWVGRTEPMEHQGRYFDIELNINLSLYMVRKPQQTALLRRPQHYRAFLVCDCSLQLFNGKFKTPLLCGRPNPSLNQFRKIERLLCTDLDNWLCNLYFQRISFLGTIFDSAQMKAVVTPERGLAIRRLATSFRIGTARPLKVFQRMLGLMAAASPVLQLGLLRMRPLQHWLKPRVPSHAWRHGRLQIRVSQACVSALTPWKNSRWMEQGMAMGMVHRRTVTTDAYNSGWGALCEGIPTFGHWSKTEKGFHINCLEMLHHSQLRSAAVCCGTDERTCLAIRLLPSLLDLSCHPRPHLSQISLTILLFSVMWFPHLHLHYCSQWLFLFGLGAHTVNLVYQGSLLSTLEEVLLVLLGPLTLNAATLLLLLIRWGCQLFIMAAAVWTVLDPLAVFAVDAILGHLSYSAEEPLADAAKLYWHLFRNEQLGTAGIILTLFLYSIHCILSFTFLCLLPQVQKLLDIYQQLHSAEGAFFVPHDMEAFNQERKVRCKVAVHVYIWTEEEPVVRLAPPLDMPITGCETSIHLSIYIQHLSGLCQHYRHFLKQPDGTIIEVGIFYVGSSQGFETELKSVKEKVLSPSPQAVSAFHS